MTPTRARHRQALVWVLLLTLPSPTWGFSVGGLEVLSLEAGKPFEARLRLTFEDYENPQAQLDARLAPDFAYPPDVAPLPFLSSITARIAGGYVILETPAALNADDLNTDQPFGLPLELHRSRDGLHLTHLYRLTTDNTAAPAANSETPATSAETPNDDAESVPPPGERRIGPIQPQDNLYNIARRLGYRNEPETWAAIFALWRRNVPDQAFINDNAFGLREGVLLTIPADLDSQVADSLPAVIATMREQHALNWQARNTPTPHVTETDTSQVLPEATAPATTPLIVRPPTPRAARQSMTPADTQAEPETEKPILLAEAQNPERPVPPVLPKAQNSETPATSAETPNDERTTPLPVSPTTEMMKTPKTPVPATLAEALKPLDAYLATKLSKIELRLQLQPASDASRLNAMLLFSASGLTILCLTTAWACRRTPKRKRPRQ